MLHTFEDVVWHVSWSVTGNILAVSGGDNKVKFLTMIDQFLVLYNLFCSYFRLAYGKNQLKVSGSASVTLTEAKVPLPANSR